MVDKWEKRFNPVCRKIAERAVELKNILNKKFLKYYADNITAQAISTLTINTSFVNLRMFEN